jgi:succinate-semialdehyde dehydrogenase / glutarate-semialdehyde dehydrogenase
VTGTLRSVDPATGDEVASYPAFTASKVDAALAAAHEAQRVWRGTSLGERARADLVDGLDRQVRDSVARGARVLTGGRRIGDRGCFYASTVLASVRPGMPVYHEETFGPVAAVIRIPDEAHAIEAANDTAYGLGASVWTRDAERGLRVARQIQSGAVFVNAVVASDPRLPFGGIKRSGYGRELSAAGIREFTNLRTWWVSGAATSTPGAALTE